jgi:hypothetical protein
MIRGRYIGLFCIILISFFYSCEKEKMNSSSDAVLHFSSSVLNFDTLTSLEPAIKNLRIVNPTKENVEISSVRLAGGKQSRFKLNINGEVANETSRFKIPANDSIYVFVEALMNKRPLDIPAMGEDSIIFSYNGIEEKVKLLAWENNFKLVNSSMIKTSTWTNEKPYLVYNYAYVDSGQQLTIEPGTKIFFHDKAGLFVKGTLNVKGTFDEPVEFRGDKAENSQKDGYERWNGIVLFSGSHNNKINFAVIKDANIGLQVGTIEHSGFASLMLSNTRIENMSWSGIWAMKSKILAYNNVISNVQYYNTALLLGGDYQFYQTTFANYYNDVSSGIRNTETLVLSNYLVDNKSGRKYVGDMKEAIFGNCIVTGNRVNELSISMDKRGATNYFFDRCLIQVADTFKFEGTTHYKEVIRNINPRFRNPYKGNFELDTLSVVKDFGKPLYARLYPYDINDVSRLNDTGPDLGAYERVERAKHNK